jgi:hypothetical protein
MYETWIITIDTTLTNTRSNVYSPRAYSCSRIWSLGEAIAMGKGYMHHLPHGRHGLLHVRPQKHNLDTTLKP